MKDIFQNQWEKLIVTLSIIFFAACWVLAKGIEEEVLKEESEGLKALRSGGRAKDLKEKEKEINSPQIDKELKNYFSNSAQGYYSIPTSPSSGFEKLPDIKISENQSVITKLKFIDSQIARAFEGKLKESDISITVSDNKIASFEIIDQWRIKINGLKYGTTSIVIRDNTLRGAKMKIEVEQTIHLKAWYLPESFTAKAAPENLNLINISWKPAKFSHPDLGRIKSYTLERQMLNKGKSPTTTPWQVIQTWSSEEAPLSYKDQNVLPNGIYRYRLSFHIDVKTNIQKGHDYKKNPQFFFDDPRNFSVLKSGSRAYNPSEIITVRKGTELLGFTRALDPGPYELNDKKNKIAQIAIKKWHNGHWVATTIRLDPLSKKTIKPPRDAIEKGLLPLVGKTIKYFKDPTQGDKKVPIDFLTNYALFYIDVHEKGEDIDLDLYSEMIPKEELRRVSSDSGKTYNDQYRSFWIIRTDDPYFTNKNIPIPRTRKILYSNRSLEKTVESITQRVKDRVKAKKEAEREEEVEIIPEDNGSPTNF